MYVSVTWEGNTGCALHWYRITDGGVCNISVEGGVHPEQKGFTCHNFISREETTKRH